MPRAAALTSGATALTCSQVNGLLVTPDHPLQHSDGRWHLPRALYSVEYVPMPQLYNFELEAGACALVTPTNHPQITRNNAQTALRALS